MVIEYAERQAAERASGVPNLTYDLIALLHGRLETIASLDIYKEDARAAGHTKALALFEHCLQSDAAVVHHLKALLGEALGAVVEESAEDEHHVARPERGGGLTPTREDNEVDDASDDSFPASDPPSFSRTTAG
jgi:hypothetical protein